MGICCTNQDLNIFRCLERCYSRENITTILLNIHTLLVQVTKIRRKWKKIFPASKR